MSHLKENGFDIMPLKKQIKHLSESKKLLEDISGEKVISFRAPALRVSKNTSVALQESGYEIDSSIASQRFDMFFSFGSLNKLRWLTSPRNPYFISNNNIFKKGDSNILEIPLSATILPYLGTTMRIFPQLTKLQRKILDLEISFNKKKPIVFDIHPNEMIDESSEKREISNRSNNFLKFFFQDYLRSILKSKNLGKEAIRLYENEIKFFEEREFKFDTLKNYKKIIMK